MDSNESASQAQGALLLSPPSTEQTTITTKKTKISTYSCNFLQHLIDHSVYPDGYEYPDGRISALPDNWDEINERLMQRRPSLSPSRFTNDDFRKFKREDNHAFSEDDPVTKKAVSMIEGEGSGDPKCTGGGYPFNNFASLTDSNLVSARPDCFDGARPEQLDRQIREELSNLIIPLNQGDRPIVLNFFLELKGSKGLLDIGKQQAYYNGALGARAIYALQSYEQEIPICDNNAYTITSTYSNSTLKLYTAHVTHTGHPDCRPEYIMTQLRAFAMTDTPETFRQGASAYRNARDWAKEKRDEIIRLANERHLNGQLSTPRANVYSSK